MIKTGRYKWVFKVGIMRDQQITVRTAGKDRATAVLRAMEQLDARHLKRGSEPPVAYDLWLESVGKEIRR